MKQATRKIMNERKVVEYLIEGKSFRWITRQKKMGNRRVKRIFNLAMELGYLDGSCALPPFPHSIFPESIDGRSVQVAETDLVLNPQKLWMTERLEAGWSPITIFEELKVKVARSCFYRFLHRHELYKLGENYRRRVVPEIIHRPGECLQVDWGKLRDVVDPVTGKKKTLWMFVGVMGFSRYMMVRLVWALDLATTVTALESMFSELGGVPEKVTSDNPKCFCIKADKYEPVLNPAFERFAAHYGFVMECLPPRDPAKKGKVERPMNYVRRLYQAHTMKWEGLEESQSYMDTKMKLANQRRHGTTMKHPVEEFLNEEVSRLRSLPAVSYQVETFSEGKVRRDGHVRFENKYYSVDEKYINQEVVIIADKSHVSLYHKGRLIEVHERLDANSSFSKQTKKHHLKPWERSMEKTSVYRKSALKIGPDVERLITAILLKGNGFIDTRKVWGILSLDKSHDKEAVNRACRKAMELQVYSYHAVKGFIEAEAISPEVLPATEINNQKLATPGENKFIRSLNVYQEQIELLN